MEIEGLLVGEALQLDESLGLLARALLGITAFPKQQQKSAMSLQERLPRNGATHASFTRRKLVCAKVEGYAGAFGIEKYH